MAVAFIREGEQVILKKDNSLKAVKVRASKKIKFDRLHFVLDNAIGKPLGSVFEVKGSKLHKIREEDDLDDLLNVQTDPDGDAGSHLILDEGPSSQKLSREDIMTMKAEGVKGKDIVDQLVENSATFKDRSEFSQAKYKNKKRKKHTTKISILKPTTRLIAEMYYHAKPSKICNLRLDSLSQILTMANVRAHSRLIVVESCHGLLLGAIMDRMGGFGSIVQMFSGDFPARFALDCFNFPDDVMQMVSGFPLNQLNALSTNKDATPTSEQESSVETPAWQLSGGSSDTECAARQDEEEEKEDDDGGFDENPDEDIPDEKELEKARRREQRLKEERTAMQELLKGNMDGLIIVSRYEPCPILLALLPFLSPSRPFVVFSQYKEPLMECYLSLRETGGAININLSETWWRHYQVLPCRTHPEITMNSSGGYLLTGITVHQGSENKLSDPDHESEPRNKKMKLENEST